MTATDFHRDLTTDPALLLLGPMLRRVTLDTVSVFVATSEPKWARLELHDSSGSIVPMDDSRFALRRLGERLYVGVLTATALDLAPDSVYRYDVLFADTESGPTIGLADVDDLLTGFAPIGYDVGALPSLLTPPERPHDLVIIQASCRKAHGCEHSDGSPMSDPDALEIVDRLIARDPDPDHPETRRPHQLFLTGDQIYSDDVAAGLLSVLTSVGDHLIGWPETFPVINGADKTPSDLPPGSRSVFLDVERIKDRPTNAYAFDWSDYSANHLLFFREWCAMYVMAWSPVMWKSIQPLWDPQLPEATDVWTVSPDTTTPALVWARSIPFVRRALANVSTYMMFDDHDVTDDWYLDINTYLQHTGQAPNGSVDGGPRLVSTALLAYAIFQHWGNVPTAFDAGLGLEVLDLAESDGGAAPPFAAQPSSRTRLEEILDVRGDRRAPTDRLLWDWVIEWDSHRVISIDTRTQRIYPDGGYAELLIPKITDPIASDWGLHRLDQLITLTTTSAPGDPVLHGHAVNFLRALHHVVRSSGGGAATTPTDVDDLRTGTVELIAAAVDTAAAQSASVTSFEATVTTSSLPADETERITSIAAALHRLVDEMYDDPLLDDGQRRDFGNLRGVLLAAADLASWAWGYKGGSAAAMMRFLRFWHRMIQVNLPNTVVAAAVPYLASVVVLRNEQEQAVTAFNADHDELGVLSPQQLDVAGLIRPAEIDRQVAQRLPDGSAGKLTVLLSPAPVFGHPFVEAGQRISASWETTPRPRETWEYEYWGGNAASFKSLLDALCPAGTVVVLSGDVHYAFTSVNDYDGGPSPLRVIQMTSSSAKNADDKTRLVAYAEYPVGVLSVLHWSFLRKIPRMNDAAHVDYPGLARELDEAVERLRHDSARQRVSGPFARLEFRRYDHAGDFLGYNVINVVDHWDYRSGFLFTATGPAPISSPLIHGLGLDLRHLLMTHSSLLKDRRSFFTRAGHSRDLASRLSHAGELQLHRFSVGKTNIGVVWFVQDADGTLNAATHDIHWNHHDIAASATPYGESRDDWAVTRHAAGFEYGTSPDVRGTDWSPLP